MLPRALPGAEPNWFGFPLTLRDGGAAERRSLQLHLLEHRIDSRLLLAGNMTLQPGFQGPRSSAYTRNSMSPIDH